VPTTTAGPERESVLAAPSRAAKPAGAVAEAPVSEKHAYEAVDELDPELDPPPP
jgi:hypothetical protein